MRIRRHWLAAIAAWLWCAWSTEVAASACSERLSRENVVACALAASALARAEREGSAALQGKQRALGSLLPSQPLLSVSGAHRVTPRQDATNWYGNLSQEVEVGGQRGARRRAVAAEQRAQENTTRGVEREVAATALRAYFEVLAARDALQLAKRMEQTFERAATAAKAAAAHGLNPGIDADLAELTSVRLTQARLEAHRHFASASAELTTLVGLDPTTTQVRVDGELMPLPLVDLEDSALAQHATAHRPEIAAAEATRASFERWSDAYRRARLSNVTLSVFAQRDGFNERVLGGGLALPIPLPGSFAHNFSGETAENAALARRADALVDQAQRDVRLEVAKAALALSTAREEQALFTEERVTRAGQTLTAVANGVADGKLAIGNMIVPQQALIEFLNQHVAAKLTLCLASVELARAAGLSLEGGTR